MVRAGQGHVLCLDMGQASERAEWRRALFYTTGDHEHRYHPYLWRLGVIDGRLWTGRHQSYLIARLFFGACLSDSSGAKTVLVPLCPGLEALGGANRVARCQMLSTGQWRLRLYDVLHRELRASRQLLRIGGRLMICESQTDCCSGH